MRIIKKINNTVLFEDLEPGDVFELEGNTWMKTETTAYSQNNAVDLFDGDIAHIDDSAPVYRVACELVCE